MPTTVYRGSPEPEERPQPRDFSGVFVSTDEVAAAQYGAVSEYEMTKVNLLAFDSPQAPIAVSFYMGEKIEDEDFDEVAPDIFMFPDDKWRDMLCLAGYDGTRFGNDICLFHPDRDLAFVGVRASLAP